MSDPLDALRQQIDAVDARLLEALALKISFVDHLLEIFSCVRPSFLKASFQI